MAILVTGAAGYIGRFLVNELVALPTDGSAPPRVVARGRDFYSFPRISPDGTRVAWTEWDHPRMPWDGTELRVAPIERSGALGEPQLVAGGPGESIWQPHWSPAGELHYVDSEVQQYELEAGEERWAFGPGKVRPPRPVRGVHVTGRGKRF